MERRRVSQLPCSGRNPHTRAIRNALKKPTGDDLGGRVLQALDIVEESMINQFQQWSQLGIQFGEVLHEASSVQPSAHHDFHAVVVAV
jgi:hypothetical protein